MRFAKTLRETIRIQQSTLALNDRGEPGKSWEDLLTDVKCTVDESSHSSSIDDAASTSNETHRVVMRTIPGVDITFENNRLIWGTTILEILAKPILPGNQKSGWMIISCRTDGEIDA